MDRPQRSLILVTGEEGSGKSTVMRALLPHTINGAKLDAEDLGQVNPFTFDQTFLRLLWSNVIAAINNFWAAGYTTVVTGSLLDGDTYVSFEQFCRQLPPDVEVIVVHLRSSKDVRDQRRIDRQKPSSREWRDRVDASYPTGDTSLSDHAQGYRYIEVDNTEQRLDQTIDTIKTAIPEIYNDATAFSPSHQHAPTSH